MIGSDSGGDDRVKTFKTGKTVRNSARPGWDRQPLQMIHRPVQLPLQSRFIIGESVLGSGLDVLDDHGLRDQVGALGEGDVFDVGERFQVPGSGLIGTDTAGRLACW